MRERRRGSEREEAVHAGDAQELRSLREKQEEMRRGVALPVRVTPTVKAQGSACSQPCSPLN